ncbi:MAG TPA: hypothetical protein PKD67_11160 [Ignavibacteriaceae bacterium]|nr:hypothetical protein [Ignavibacteriaceae bacterium]
METSKLFLKIIIVLFFTSFSAFAQGLNIYQFIGKSTDAVISEFGKPLHINNNNPSMTCLTYYNPSINCMADQNGIYQIEMVKNFTSTKEALDEIRELLAKSVTEGLVIDSVSASKYILYKKGVKTNIILNEIKNSPTIELRIKAIRESE